MDPLLEAVVAVKQFVADVWPTLLLVGAAGVALAWFLSAPTPGSRIKWDD